MKKKKSKSSNPSGEDKKIYKSYEVEKVIPGGDGLIRVDGKVFFIPGVLPGEIIDFEVISEGKKFSRGAVTAINQPSPDRTGPICEYYGRCGGCNLQHLDYQSQLQLKTSFVREHFQRLAGISLQEDFFFVPSREQSYRNRVQFHKSGDFTGFKERAGESVIPVSHCPILVDPLNTFLSESDPLKQERETFFGDGERYWRESVSDVITVHIDSKPVKFRADLFFQSNLSVLPELLRFALDGYSGNHAMDLYCGVGLFSVFLKDHYKEITAIELNPETEAFYRMNMEGSCYEYFGMPLEHWLKKKKNQQTDLIVLDPPRTGLSEKVRSYLAQMKVKDLVYVSCDPVTQARDTGDLLSSGYRLDSIRGFDFYPHTSHMETVCRFTR